MKDADFIGPEVLTYPPLVHTEKTPQDIIGPFASLIKRHLEVAAKATSENMDKLFSAKFSEQERKMIAEMYAELRKNGMYPMGIDSMNRIMIGIITDRNHKIMENLDPPPKKLTSEMIRDFRKKQQNMLKSIPDASDLDIETERELTKGI